jgi:molybdenum cofactor biosynthesis protein B
MSTYQVDVAVIAIGSPSAGGQLVKSLLEENNHQVATYKTVKDVPRQIKGELAIITQSFDCKAIILSGGTDFLLRETAYDAVYKLLDKRLDGFGEIFRALAHQEIGSAAVSLRATAGTYQRRLLFCIPADPDAVRLVMNKLILPELPDLVRQINRIG